MRTSVSSRTIEEQNADVRAVYRDWKARYLTSAGRDRAGHPLYRVKFSRSGDQARFTVSEGQGYGMVIVATMAGAEPDARALFDGLWWFSRKFPSTIEPTMMAWKVTETANVGDDSAFDGDVDIAYALLLADAQWGSNGPVNYRAEFTRVAAGLERAVMGAASHYPLLGDWVNPAGSQYNQWTFRTSDLAPGHFKAFAVATGRAIWTDALATSRSVVERLQTVYAPDTGLLPDFVQPVNTQNHAARPADAGFLEGDSDGSYSYNACRDPWRLGTGALLANDADLIRQVRRISGWARDRSGGDPAKIHAGYALDGSPLPDTNYFSAAFVGPLGVAAMVDDDPAAQDWLNRVYQRTVQSRDNYYEDSLALLSLLVMTRNFWSPE